MSLEQELAAFKAEFSGTAPAGRAALYEAKIEELRADFALERAVNIDEIAPDFALPNAVGKLIVLKDLLRSGPVVLTFYRGGWCPYCNIQLRAYQSILSQMSALGARLVAISPQLPDSSLDTVHKNALTFDVLSDVGNEVARDYGLVYSLPEEIPCSTSLEQQGSALDQRQRKLGIAGSCDVRGSSRRTRCACVRRG
jgi:peroxiredoxin